MAELRTLYNFPRGERCEECGATKWYLEAGRRFCQNGDMVEGFVQFDYGSDDDVGKKGKTFKREKEAREVERLQLTGPAGRNLYLECLQLILRRQISWLVDVKRYPDVLEQAVKDLWDLRIRGAPSDHTAESDRSEIQLFSSQSSQSSDNDDESVRSRRSSRSRDWGPEQEGREWPTPRLIESLGICYLGLLLLSVPVALGELFRWANDFQIPYRTECSRLPPEMLKRLPSTYARVLKEAVDSPIKDGDLHACVRGLVSSYSRNYRLGFPSLNDFPLFVQYSIGLSLPAEVIEVAARLAHIVGISFSYKPTKPRVRLMDDPEIALVANIVIATKLMFPFRSAGGSVMRESEAICTPRLDWKIWRGLMNSDGNAGPTKPMDYRAATADEVVAMSDDNFDAYLAHVSTFIDDRGENSLTTLFPFDGGVSADAKRVGSESSSSSSSDAVDQARLVQERAVTFEEKRVVSERAMKIEMAVAPERAAVPEEAAAVLGDTADVDTIKNCHTEEAPDYGAYRTAGDIDEAAEPLYRTAAHLAGISLSQLARAVYMCEMALVARQGQLMTTGHDSS